MMIKLVLHNIEYNTVGGVLLVDRDSIMAACQLCKDVFVHDFDENGKKIYGTGRQETVEYTEVILKNGYTYQVFNNLNSIEDMVNGK